MTERRQRRRSGLLPTVGPANCWRSIDIKRPCATCGSRTAPMHSPTRLAGIYCGACCP